MQGGALVPYGDVIRLQNDCLIEEIHCGGIALLVDGAICPPHEQIDSRAAGGIPVGDDFDGDLVCGFRIAFPLQRSEQGIGAAGRFGVERIAMRQSFLRRG